MRRAIDSAGVRAARPSLNEQSVVGSMTSKTTGERSGALPRRSRCPARILIATEQSRRLRRDELARRGPVSDRRVRAGTRLAADGLIHVVEDGRMPETPAN